MKNKIKNLLLTLFLSQFLYLSVQAMISQTSKPAVYLGCYTDNEDDRDVKPGYMPSGGVMTVDICIDFCLKNAYKYAAIQYGGECWCGNSYGKHGKLNDSSCDWECEGNKNQYCGGFYANDIYLLDSPCFTDPSPCGIGAYCSLDANSKPVCSCPVDKPGNPLVRCCNPISCSCWGDPHCFQFDGNIHHNMGRCLYDMVTTDCGNNGIMPKGLFPFSVRQKQEGRKGVPGEDIVSFVQYIEVHINDDVYRLYKRNETNFYYSLNGNIRSPPYSDRNGTNVFVTGGKIAFSSNIGLTVTFDGNEKTEVFICDSYGGHVCGLCGNADGNDNNDFVDRNNTAVPLVGDIFSKYFQWATNWKADMPDEPNATDINGAQCKKDSPPGPSPPGPKCKNISVYDANNWCGLMNNPTGPWADCIKNSDPNIITGIMHGCSFDLCALEGNETLQFYYKCKSYETFAAQCLDLATSLNKTFTSNWRAVSNCVIKCGENEVFETRNECPKTCLYPNGAYDCGQTSAAEGCYCKAGYVYESGKCISSSQCGCISPDGTFTLQLNQVVNTIDCKKEYTCNKPGNVTVKDLPRCSINSACSVDASSQPKCLCADGFSGDGYHCCGDHQLCYIYGDPHYLRYDKSKFDINNECSYLVASDNCASNQASSYQIFAQHSYRNLTSTDPNAVGYYLKKVTIKIGVSVYELDTNLYANGAVKQLPYSNTADGISFSKDSLGYIKAESVYFRLWFDGEFFKLSQCENTLCGLCGVRNLDQVEYGHSTSNDIYLVNDSSKPQCSSSATFPAIKH